jgi:hypothetical protein
MPDRSPQLESLRRLVRRFGGFRWQWSVLHGLALAVLALPGSLLVWFLLDWAFRLPPWPLVILFAVAAIGGIVAAIVCGVPPLFRRVKLEREAVVIESLHRSLDPSRHQSVGGGLDNQIIGSLQLGEEGPGRPAAPSGIRRSSSRCCSTARRPGSRTSIRDRFSISARRGGCCSLRPP